MITLNQKLLPLCQPHSYDPTLAEQKKLARDGVFTEEYFTLHRRYTDGLIACLDQTLHLDEWDRTLAASEMCFVPCDRPFNLYQAYGAGPWKFLFLRSNVCIERLSIAELNRLRLLESPEELMPLVRDTMFSVLLADADEPDDMGIIYEPDGKHAPNRALVLGLATALELNESGEMVNALHEREKTQFLTLLIPEMEKVFSDALELPVVIFQY